jgi:hypothetical protein
MYTIFNILLCVLVIREMRKPEISDIFILGLPYSHRPSNMQFGRAIAQAVSRRLSTAAARVRSQVR